MGFSHSYALHFTWLDGAGRYGAAATLAWREAFAALSPPLPPAPTRAQLYRSSMDLLHGYASVNYAGLPSMPFEAQLPSGTVVDASSQMGFVGRALPCAALMLYDAVLASPNPAAQARAVAILDLWAAQAPTSCGVVKTWYNVGPGDREITWRPSDAYQGALRIMCDGMKGLLDAWAMAPPGIGGAWLSAAVKFADFLVANMDPGGGIFGAWDWDCHPLATDKRQTPQIIPFLVAAFRATGEGRYRLAALRAGAFSAALFRDQFVYQGGAVDNPDVPDKEAGWLAAQAFIALYELTGDGAAWLGPAAQAANYAATFVYGWNIPIPCAQNPATVYPCHRTSLGASIIATGQSGADNFMAIAWFDYRRLGQWTGDTFFPLFADFLEASTTQVVNWDGSLGYAARGLLTEAATFSVRRGAGVMSWLPWLTANVLQPLVQEQRNATAYNNGRK